MPILSSSYIYIHRGRYARRCPRSRLLEERFFQSRRIPILPYLMNGAERQPGIEPRPESLVGEIFGVGGGEGLF